MGLTPLAASRKMALPEDRVAAWEAGEVAPTIAQLRKAAEVYKRSLAVFFLAEPPRDLEGSGDFLRGRARPARETVIRFIAEHKDHQVPGPDGGAGLRWGVEPMCEAPSKAGIAISPSTYYEWVASSTRSRSLPGWTR